MAQRLLSSWPAMPAMDWWVLTVLVRKRCSDRHREPWKLSSTSTLNRVQPSLQVSSACRVLCRVELHLTLQKLTSLPNCKRSSTTALLPSTRVFAPQAWPQPLGLQAVRGWQPSYTSPAQAEYGQLRPGSHACDTEESDPELWVKNQPRQFLYLECDLYYPAPFCLSWVNQFPVTYS